MIVNCMKMKGYKSVKGNEKEICEFLLEHDFYKNFSIQKINDNFEFFHKNIPLGGYYYNYGEDYFDNGEDSFVKLNEDGSISIFDKEQSSYKYVAIKFNNESRFKKDYVAILKKNDEGKLYISVERRGTNNTIESERMEASHKLNQKLRKFLSSKSISIDALNALDLELGRTGIIDYGKAEDEVLGLIKLIRLAKGSLGEEALPIVFSRFILNSLKLQFYLLYLDVLTKY